jgi:CelD/BcsL family acetyltransferase involved in cellulose biosynthesis
MTEHTTHWRLRWLRNWDEIWSPEFQMLWQELAEHGDLSHAFFHPALVKAWVDTYVPLRTLKPFFLLAQTDDTTVLLPLVLWKRNWKGAFQKLLIPAGFSDFDYHDPLWRGPLTSESIQSFWAALLTAIHAITPRPNRVILDGLRFLPEMLGDEHPIPSWQRTPDACPFIDLDGFTSIDDLLESMKAPKRRELKRRKRRLEELEGFQYLNHSNASRETILSELPRMLELHAKRWPNAYKAPDYHARLLTAAAHSHILSFSTLVVAGKAISWRVGFMWRDRYYSYMPTFDDEYRVHSPGQVHLLYCLQEAIDHKLRVFDQLRGEEAYKDEWADGKGFLYRFVLASRSPVSRLKALLLEDIKPRFAKARPERGKDPTES